MLRVAEMISGGDFISFDGDEYSGCIVRLKGQAWLEHLILNSPGYAAAVSVRGMEKQNPGSAFRMKR